MNDREIQADTPLPCGPQLQAAFDELRRIVVDGLRHGHFEGAISIGTLNGKRRELLIKAGNSYRFTISLDELPR